MSNIDYKQEIVERLRFISGHKTTDTLNIQFLKQRSIPGRIVQAIIYTDRAGQAIDFICYLAQDTQGRWHFRGGTGRGSGTGTVRNHPWVELAGGGWPHDFYAGGYIVNQGSEVARVRLIASTGVTMEDSVDDQLVLFLTDQKVDIPFIAELYDRSGKLILRHDGFNVRIIP